MQQLYLGFITIIISLFTLLLALQQKQMVLLFWAIFFLCLVLVMLLLHLAHLYNLKILSRAIKLFLKQEIYARQNFNLKYMLSSKIIAWPIFYYSLEIEAFFADRKWTSSVAIDISKPSSESGLTMLAGARGIYQVKSQIVAKDLFGFFKTSSPLKNDLHELTFFSNMAKNSFLAINKLKQNSASSQNSHQKTDEKFDSRKYYAGDDPRLINWKQFSHYGELFIRREERGASLVSDYLVIIYPPKSNNQLDILLEQSLAIASLIEANASEASLLVGPASIKPFLAHLHSTKHSLASYSLPFAEPLPSNINASKETVLLLYHSASITLRDLRQDFRASNCYFINENGELT